MNAQAGPKDVESVLDTRYWLTPKGEAAVAAITATSQENA